MRFCLLALLLAHLSTLTAGCTRACTQVGCSDQTVVTFIITADPEKAYTLSYSSEGRSGSLTCTHDGMRWECIPQPGTGPDGSPTSSAYGFVDENGAVYYLEPLDDPVELTFTADSDVLFMRTVTPNYVAYQPNGPDCPPTCRRATVEATL